MSHNQHLSEIELIELVEDDLPDTEAASARAHVAACEECTASLATLEQARLSLRAAPLLELPEERFREMLRQLPAQEGEAPGWRRVLAHPRRWLVVLAPVATVAAVVLVVVVVAQNSSGGDEEAAAPAPAEPALEMQAEAAQADSSAAAPAPVAGEAAPAEPPAEPAAPPAEPAEPPAAEPPAESPGPEEGALREKIRNVAGTPAEIAERLRQQDFDARVVDGTVEVEGADPEAVAKALEDVPNGDVAVIVVPAS